MGYLSGQREQTVNLPANAYEGSNPSPTITSKGQGFLLSRRGERCGLAGVAQLVEH